MLILWAHLTKGQKITPLWSIDKHSYRKWVGGENKNPGPSTRTRERELQLLHTDPGALIGRDVYMRWTEDGIDTGAVHGIVKDHNNDHDGEHLCGHQMG
jgi:hypothetical protein